MAEQLNKNKGLFNKNNGLFSKFKCFKLIQFSDSDFEVGYIMCFMTFSSQGCITDNHFRFEDISNLCVNK